MTVEHGEDEHGEPTMRVRFAFAEWVGVVTLIVAQVSLGLGAYQAITTRLTVVEQKAIALEAKDVQIMATHDRDAQAMAELLRSIQTDIREVRDALMTRGKL